MDLFFIKLSVLLVQLWLQSLSPPHFTRMFSVIHLSKKTQNTKETKLKMNLTDFYYSFIFLKRYCDNIVIVNPLGHYNRVVKI